MQSIKLFLTEVTEELLYNIVYDEDEIDYHELSEKFEEKTGYRPMDFFGQGNITDGGWFAFIKGIPGVEGTQMISIRDDSDSSCEDSNDDDDDGSVYRIFNRTSFDEGTVAKYREMILIRCCEIISIDWPDLSIDSKDKYGNTPLHFIAALPGISYDCNTLVKYLLKAGVDPLATNDDGKTFLHIIFGRFKAIADDGCFPLHFTNERVPKTEWFVEDKVKLLELLSKKLSEKDTVQLGKSQDNNGNTVLHEYAMSTIVQQKCIKDKLCKNLLKFGVNLRVQNNSGEVPLHYAYNSSVFKIFIQNGAVCRARNDRDETPVLFILKKLLEHAFAQTSAAAELEDQGYVNVIVRRSVKKAVQLLGNLKTIISDNDKAKETVWIPDLQGNTTIDLLLIAVRIISYNISSHSKYIPELRTSLVDLLREMLPDATSSVMKRQNKKGQSFLHVLLDMGDKNKHTISEEAFILQGVQALLDHHVNINAEDSKGRTPLDITLKHLDKGLNLYKKCADLLVKHGAVRKGDIVGTRFTNQSSPQSSLLQRMTNLRIKNETRKLRSCPKRHKENAQRLTNPSTEVTIVEKKYRYSDQFLIGSGAFSSVFIAIKDEHVDSKSGAIECRAYAMKRLEKAKINSQEIKREITTLLSISGKCDNIIKCHEAVEDLSFQYLCLDLMDGDLNEFVSNDRVNRVMKKNPLIHGPMAKGIIDGLVYLHKKKFIHRDFKPGNILYATDPKLHFKITDFGLTKNLSSSCSMTSTRGSGVAMAPGTRCWMAPELVSVRSGEHTKESDIFSLGLVLHYLLTLGKHPFATTNEEPPHVIEQKIVSMEINLDRALQPEATSFLQVLLTKKPSKRPPAAFFKQHPFLWSESKKIEFLKAVGDQPEAVNPGNFYYSALEESLQTTNTGRKIKIVAWDQDIRELYDEMTRAWKQKKYRTDKVIDLLRFIRNAYSHKQERTPEARECLDENILLQVYPKLVLDVFGVVQKLGFDDDENRSNIREALSLDM